MPDFSMCRAAGCRRSRQCKRHEASGTKPSHWQSWSAFRPHENGAGCDYFVPANKESDHV